MTQKHQCFGQYDPKNKISDFFTTNLISDPKLFFLHLFFKPKIKNDRLHLTKMCLF